MSIYRLVFSRRPNQNRCEKHFWQSIFFATYERTNAPRHRAHGMRHSSGYMVFAERPMCIFSVVGNESLISNTLCVMTTKYNVRVLLCYVFFYFFHSAFNAFVILFETKSTHTEPAKPSSHHRVRAESHLPLYIGIYDRIACVRNCIEIGLLVAWFFFSLPNRLLNFVRRFGRYTCDIYRPLLANRGGRNKIIYWVIPSHLHTLGKYCRCHVCSNGWKTHWNAALYVWISW